MLDKTSLFPLLLSTIAGLSTVLGAIIIFFSKTRNEKFLTFSLGFSAGVMITVSFTIDIFIPEEEKGTVPKCNNDFDIFRVGLVSTIALMIHNFPEGIATFVSGYQDASLGIAVTLAIALHNIPEGIAIAMPIYFATRSRYKAIKYSFLSGMAEPLGALIAFLCLKPFINELILGIIFAVVCGIMIYISLDELIPSSRKYGYTRLSVASIFLGICIMPITHLFI